MTKLTIEQREVINQVQALFDRGLHNGMSREIIIAQLIIEGWPQAAVDQIDRREGKDG